MTQAIATVSLLAASLAIHLGNFWYVYGIWPRSWSAFVLFWVLTMVNYGLLSVVSSSKD